MQLDRLRKTVSAAISDYDMIEDGDRVMVAVSGGKDSALLLILLEQIRRKWRNNFSLYPVLLDQKQPGFDVAAFQSWIEKKTGLTLEIIEEDTYSIVKEKVAPGKSFCGLCSRLRRGVLYNFAFDRKYTKIALGHHRDDANETLMMNLFFNGSLASMPPKLKSDDGRNQIIRPLIYTAEEDLEAASKDLEIPVIPCNLCGSQKNLQRAKMKKLIKEFSKDHEHVASSMWKAQQNIKASQLADIRYW